MSISYRQITAPDQQEIAFWKRREELERQERVVLQRRLRHFQDVIIALAVACLILACALVYSK